MSGIMHLSFLTYFTWLNEELISVPNFPAWVCDVCGFTGEGEPPEKCPICGAAHARLRRF